MVNKPKEVIFSHTFITETYSSFFYRDKSAALALCIEAILNVLGDTPPSIKVSYSKLAFKGSSKVTWSIDGSPVFKGIEYAKLASLTNFCSAEGLFAKVFYARVEPYISNE